MMKFAVVDCWCLLCVFRVFFCLFELHDFEMHLLSNSTKVVVVDGKYNIAIACLIGWFSIQQGHPPET